MSTRIDLLDALHRLPRYNGDSTARPKWSVTGRKLMVNGWLLPDKVLKNVRKIMGQIDRHHYEPTIEYVDVNHEDIHVLHRNLRWRNILFLYKLNWKFQKWRKRELPIYIRFRGKLIIWNGTHRMTLGRLANRKIRARVFDFDHFFKWAKTHPVGWDARVITFGKPRAKIIKVKKVKRRGRNRQ